MEERIPIRLTDSKGHTTVVVYYIYWKPNVPLKPANPNSVYTNGTAQYVPDTTNAQWANSASVRDPLFYSGDGALLGELNPQAAQPYSGLANALTSGNLYAYNVSLMDGDDAIAVGSGNENPIEIGQGGTATITGGANSSVWIWHDKNVVWTTTGTGNSLVFDAEAGAYYAPSGSLFLNLATGTGSNPWGGTLSFQGVDQIAVGALAGDEYIVCNNDGDTINEGSGSLQIAGSTLIVGGTGNDTLHGANTEGSGANVNVLVAGPGADTLIGGASYGGSATETNIFSYNSGVDTIADFGTADMIDLSALSAVSNLSDVLSHTRQVGGNVMIDFGGGESITIDDTSKAALTSANFLFAPETAFAFTEPGFAPPAAFAYTEPRQADTGETVQIYLAMTGPFTVNTSGGSPTLLFTDGTSATYDAAATNSADHVLVFDYAVSSGYHDPDLTIEGMVSGGAVIDGAAGQSVNFTPVSGAALGLQINPSPLYVTSVTVTSGASVLVSGAEIDSGGVINIALGMSESGFTVNTSSGTPYLVLDDGETASYVGTSGSQLDFTYTVQSGDYSSDLTISGVGLGPEGSELGAPGATIVDGGGYVADFTNALNASTGVQIGPSLYASSVQAALYSTSIISGLLPSPISSFIDVAEVDSGATVEVIITMNEAVSVSGAPTLTLNDGGTASYNSGLSDPVSGMLVFDHSIGSGNSSPDLSVTAISGGTIVDQNNVAANFTNIDLLTTDVQVGPSPLTVEKVSASTHGHVASGKDVFLTLQMSEPVSVGNFGETGLSLNDGETAFYDASVSIWRRVNSSSRISSELAMTIQKPATLRSRGWRRAVFRTRTATTRTCRPRLVFRSMSKSAIPCTSTTLRRTLLSPKPMSARRYKLFWI